MHIGHLSMLKAAAARGRVLVALNSDEWLLRKKGYVFMPWPERATILRALACVYEVVTVDDADGTVVAALAKYLPDEFANGGDRTLDNSSAPEREACMRHGIRELFSVGGAKMRSSSDLVTHARLPRP